MVPRQMVLGIDKMERGVSFVAGSIALLLALIISPHLFKNSYVTDTLKPSKAHTCIAGYHLVASTCSRTRLTHPSDWLPQFLEILIVGIAIIAFAWWRKRAGVAVGALFLGLALGTVGLPFLFLGGWLIIRALRLQKYGDATFRGSSAQAREMGKVRRQEKGTSKKALKSKAATPNVAPPSPSKRYTPKQQPRKR
jgi:hypothetical protein